MKTCSVQLRQEVYREDAIKIIDWLEDEDVTRYLNEDRNAGRSIRQVMDRVNMPILTHLFNQNGSFFIITTEEEGSIGFLRLVPKVRGAEIVVAIGDKNKWGRGLGSNAIKQGLKKAFFEWRVNEVIAKINARNERSIRAFKRVGFKKEKDLEREEQFSISIDEFLRLVA